jgi:hypothetical protein
MGANLRFKRVLLFGVSTYTIKAQKRHTGENWRITGDIIPHGIRA